MLLKEEDLFELKVSEVKKIEFKKSTDENDIEFFIFMRNFSI